MPRSDQNPEGDGCVDVFWRPDGSFGFEEFRRDPGGLDARRLLFRRTFTTEDEARTGARDAVPWLALLRQAHLPDGRDGTGR